MATSRARLRGRKQARPVKGPIRPRPLSAWLGPKSLRLPWKGSEIANRRIVGGIVACELPKPGGKGIRIGIRRLIVDFAQMAHSVITRAESYYRVRSCR